ncbi:3'-5' ssDNA/RNA exonuclease TatD-like [Diadema setosum]|uniref:3'-5' ssDNA/RNA exonuclease TatD-like n=1 Tax=Diadema setosum TaxID=31175 RepID=UPI003B3B7156
MRGRILILHLRGVEDQTGVHVISRRLIQRSCPGDQRIHLHSFSGDSLQVRARTARFPHCYFGVSALVRSLPDPQRTAVREIPLDRLLLEIDAPHLAPHPGMRYNMPCFLGDVGRLVADIRGLPLAWLMAVTTANAQRLYGY